ncbi:MAG: glutathione peroxidase, partial [Pseudomonadota bacterium]
MVAGLQGEPAHAANQEPGKAFTFDFRTIDNKPMPLEQFRGKALLVVNTASFCGFTGQYGDLQDVWERYRDDGLVVIGVPSNDFGEQEPGTAEEIKTFCEVNFDIDFPLARKVAVKGADAHPFYAWARETLGAAKAPGP